MCFMCFAKHMFFHVLKKMHDSETDPADNYHANFNIHIYTICLI